MVTTERLSEIAARLRDEGAVEVSDHLQNAHDGVFSGTELAMKWRFHLAEALKLEGLSAATRQEAQRAWCKLEAALS
jgi:hypothetical protein